MLLAELVRSSNLMESGRIDWRKESGRKYQMKKWNEKNTGKFISVRMDKIRRS